MLRPKQCAWGAGGVFGRSMTGDSERILVGLSTGQLVQFSWDATVRRTHSLTRSRMRTLHPRAVARVADSGRGGRCDFWWRRDEETVRSSGGPV